MKKPEAAIVRSAGEPLKRLNKMAARAAANQVIGSIGILLESINAFRSRHPGNGVRLFLFPMPFRGYKRRTILPEGLGRVMIRVENRTITSSDNAH